MKQKAVEERIDRRRIPSLLARKFIKDYEASVASFPENKKEEFLEHLLGCLDVVGNYIANPTEENYKIYADKENAFLKKHGNRLKMYRQTRMYLYFGDHGLLNEKEIYTVDEWNSYPTDKQRLSKEEFADLFHLCRNSLYLEREYLWLSQSPEDENEAEEKNKSKEAVAETAQPLNGGVQLKKGRRKRVPNDNLTSISVEQTILLVHYLRLEKVFLNGDDLTDTEAGKALEVLTGYSQHTQRQHLKDFEDYQKKPNLNQLLTLLTRMQKAIKADLEGV